MYNLVEVSEFFKKLKPADYIAVADNPMTPKHILEILAVNKSYKVRASVACHPSTPISALKELSKDTDFYVAQVAAKKLFVLRQGL